MGRVFALLDPRALQACLLNWIRTVSAMTHGDVVAIEGKTLRRSFDRAAGQTARHLISAWACQHRLVLGQLRTEAPSNEITAIPQLLPLLDVACREDHSRIRTDHAPEHVALVRRMALNRLKRESSRRSINVKRLRAACDHDSLAKSLFPI